MDEAFLALDFLALAGELVQWRAVGHGGTGHRRQLHLVAKKFVGLFLQRVELRSGTGWVVST